MSEWDAETAAAEAELQRKHEAGKTELAGIADRIKVARMHALRGDKYAFIVTMYLHESIDTENALRSVPPEVVRSTVVEFCGKPAAAPCAIEEQCQYGADRNQIIEECAKVAESYDTEKGHNYAGLAADAIRALKTTVSPLVKKP